MTPADQIDTINNTAVLIGQHGAGLTHSLFLHNDATLVELSTTDWDQVWFQTLNTDLGLRYRSFTIDGLHTALERELIHEISDFVSMTGWPAHASDARPTSTKTIGGNGTV